MLSSILVTKIQVSYHLMCKNIMTHFILKDFVVEDPPDVKGERAMP